MIQEQEAIGKYVFFPKKTKLWEASGEWFKNKSPVKILSMYYSQL